MTNASPGWLSDPTGRHEHRYWDGTQWTDQVADGGVAASDPLAPSAVADAPPLGGPPAPDLVPPGTSSADPVSGGYPPPGGGHLPPGSLTPGGYPPPASSSGPSTGLLVGLGIVVAGLVVAITVVILAGSDSDDSGDSEIQAERGDDLDDSEVDQLVETDELGMGSVVEQLIADLGGAIDEDDAQCMLRGAVRETIGLGHLADNDPGAWPEEDQISLLRAMFGDDCFDDPEGAVADILAAGGAQDPDISQADADCWAGKFVDAAGLDAIYRYLAGFFDETMSAAEEEAWFMEWLESLPVADQQDVADSYLDCDLA